MKNLCLLILFSALFFSCKKENEILPENNDILSNEIKTDTINWYTELCEINSSFETNKYTKKQLRNTFQLWFGNNSYIDFDGYPVFELDDKIHPIEELEKKYIEKKKDLENLEIIDSPFWQNIKKLKLSDLKAFYEFEKNAFYAYKNTELLAKTSYDIKASVYVDALISKDSVKMIAAWKLLNEEQKSKNGSPSDVENRFQSRLNSNKCLEYAKMELFSFGWANNALKTSKNSEILNRTDVLHTEYLKLFISTTEECAEP